MAKVMIEDIVDHLSYEMRRALEETFKTAAPSIPFDAYQLFREFVRNVGRKCSTWETVPDRYVKTD